MLTAPVQKAFSGTYKTATEGLKKVEPDKFLHLFKKCWKGDIPKGSVFEIDEKQLRTILSNNLQGSSGNREVHIPEGVTMVVNKSTAEAAADFRYLSDEMAVFVDKGAKFIAPEFNFRGINNDGGTILANEVIHYRGDGNAIGTMNKAEIVLAKDDSVTNVNDHATIVIAKGNAKGRIQSANYVDNSGFSTINYDNILNVANIHGYATPKINKVHSMYINNSANPDYRTCEYLYKNQPLPELNSLRQHMPASF